MIFAVLLPIYATDLKAIERFHIENSSYFFGCIPVLRFPAPADQQAQGGYFGVTIAAPVEHLAEFEEAKVLLFSVDIILRQPQMTE